MGFLSHFFFHVYKFFGSLKLALGILFALIVVFAAGTLIESKHGAETAKILVYDAPWFTIIGFLLAMNVSASAIDRLPWKRKHIGFVMTHTGIIIILIGSFITKISMVDAQLPIAEGKTVNEITFTDPVLQIISQSEPGRIWQTALERKPFPWQGEERLSEEGLAGELPFNVELTHYYPKGRLNEKLIPAEEGPAAIELNIKNSFLEETFWLVEGDPEKNEIVMGPATFKFSDTLLKELSPENANQHYLEVIVDETNTRVPLSESLSFPHTVLIEGSPYTINVQAVYENAIIENGKIREKAIAENKEGQAENRAAVLIITGDGKSEKHTAFASFPDFPTRHGLGEGVIGAKVFYRLPGAGSRGESHELRFVQTDKGLLYQVQDGIEIKTGTVLEGEPISTGWMDLSFTVRQYFPSSTKEIFFTPEPNTSESINVYPAIRLQIDSEDKNNNLWLAQGSAKKIKIKDKEYFFFYTQRKEPLGFKIKLRDFMIKKQPGTENPASFESDVTVIDEFKGFTKDVNISMNEPLDYNGFRIFQASYSLPEDGGPEISIFAVVKDPGIMVKYFGTIVMITGIIVMFVLSRLNFKNK